MRFKVVFVYLLISVNGQRHPLSARQAVPNRTESSGSSTAGRAVPSSAPLSLHPPDRENTLQSDTQIVIHSDTSSELPSDVPSSVPSDQPSMVPSDIPSRLPSDVPSLQPSDIPSMQPTDDPTLSPSHYPSFSQSPSNTPTRSPSSLPSTLPTTAPSHVPTMQPSIEPSMTPSSIPSSIPSQIPTLECHDLQQYRNPLNNFTCADNSGFDCLIWRSLGMAVGDVVNLVNSCPVSCDIPCNSLQSLNVSLPVKLTGVTEFLNPGAVATLESVSEEYLANVVSQSMPESVFFLYDVELLSQKEEKRSVRHRTRRALQSTVTLFTTVAFRGFGVDVLEADIEALLRTGINSDGYTKSLQRSGDGALVDVVVSSNIREDDITAIQKPVEESGSGRRAGVTASIVLSTLFVTAVAAYFVQSRVRARPSIGKKPPVAHEHSSDVVSPALSVRSSLVNALSFDTIMRMVSSPRSNDSDSSTEQSSIEKSNPEESNGEPLNEKPHDERDEEKDEPHPLASIVPPMIVIDNIEGRSSDTERPNVKNIVPGRRVEASPEFVKQLRASAGKIDPALLFLPFLEPAENDEAEQHYTGELSSSSSSASMAFRDSKEISDSHNDVIASPDKTTPTRSSFFHRMKTPRTSKIRPDNSASPSSHKEGSPMNNSFGSNGENGTEGSLSGGSRSGLFSFFTSSPGRSKKTASNSSGSPKSIPSGSFRLSKSASLESDTKTDEKGTKSSREVVFEIPRHGKLGITVLCNISQGPTVQQVKDYSPLLGKAFRGDRILSIDGVSTVGATLTEVTRLLARKGGSRWQNLQSPLKIVFLRSEEDSTRALKLDTVEVNASENDETVRKKNKSVAVPGCPTVTFEGVHKRNDSISSNTSGGCSRPPRHRVSRRKSSSQLNCTHSRNSSAETADNF